MSVQRYGEWPEEGMSADSDGDYVTYEDYVKLEAENQALQKRIAELEHHQIDRPQLGWLENE